MRKEISSKIFKQLAVIFPGLFLLALGVDLMIAAQLGCDPWTTFLVGGQVMSGLSVGRVAQFLALFLICLNFLLARRKPGLGTILNMIFLGLFIDLINKAQIIPPANYPGLKVFYLVSGVFFLGFGTALYISAGLGEGPTDGLMLVLTQRLHKSLKFTRISLDITVLTLGYLMGGPLGFGTIVAALGTGPIIQFSLRKLPVPAGPA